MGKIKVTGLILFLLTLITLSSLLVAQPMIRYEGEETLELGPILIKVYYIPFVEFGDEFEIRISVRALNSTYISSLKVQLYNP